MTAAEQNPCAQPGALLGNSQFQILSYKFKSVATKKTTSQFPGQNDVSCQIEAAT